MPDEHYRRMQELFEAAGKLEAAERESFLASRCRNDPALKAEVESLLAHEAPAAATLDGAASPHKPPSSDDPVQIGPYRILGVLGEGGFGVVYLAERQTPMVQRVALKVIKPGMDSRSVIRRFDQERQALAVMDHPNVARVFDAGVTGPEQGSRPYFVMEHAEGEAITAYCDRRRLTVRRRLELFIPVCEAVQHAHMKGIIHRDIKPGNILVSEVDGTPIPKVIDFGVAKAIAPTLTAQTVFTEQGQIIGTPEYMSPEQARMGATDIDTRTDVYSLGVVLYELLTGALPFSRQELWSKGFAELQRIIREIDPPRPSTRLSSPVTQQELETAAAIAQARHTRLADLSQELRRELEWIPLKAMRKDRGERYRSPLELADDIRNYLNGRPLIAGPESASYRVRKFVRRRRGTVIAGAAVAASLLAGFVASTVFAVGQAKARSAEARQYARAEAINSFLAGILTAADPDKAKGENVTVREALDAAAKRIDAGELRDQPLVEAEIHFTIGTTYTNLGLYKEAQSHFRAADAAQTRDLGELHLDTLRTRTRLVEAMQFEAIDYPGVVAIAKPTLAALRRTAGPDHPETLKAMLVLGSVLGEVGRWPEGEAFLLDAIEGHRRAYGREHPMTADALDSLGTQYVGHSQAQKSESLHREAWRIHAAALGNDDPRTLRSVHCLADAMFNLRLANEGLQYYLIAYEGRNRVLGPDSVETIGSRVGMGLIASQQGRLEESLAIHQECLGALIRRTGGTQNHYVVNQQRFTAAALHAIGRHEEAAAMYREAIDSAVKLFGEDHYDTSVRLMCEICSVLIAQGRFPEAEEASRRALDALYRVQPRPYGSQVARASQSLMSALRALNKADETLQVGRELIDFLVQAAREPDAPPADLNLAAWQLVNIEDMPLRDPKLALDLATRAVQMSESREPYFLSTQATAFHHLGRNAEAAETIQKAIAILPPDATARKAEYEARFIKYQAATQTPETSKN